MGRRGPKPNRYRDMVLALARRGEIASLREGSWLAAVTTTRVYVWLREAGIDIKASRALYLAALRRRAQLIAKGKRPKRRTKAQQRAIAERAKRAWDTRKS